MGERSRQAIFVLCEKGSVYDLLLYIAVRYLVVCQLSKRAIPYFTRSKTETLFPTGESKHVPSGVKSRFPLR